MLKLIGLVVVLLVWLAMWQMMVHYCPAFAMQGKMAFGHFFCYINWVFWGGVLFIWKYLYA